MNKLIEAYKSIDYIQWETIKGVFFGAFFGFFLALELKRIGLI